jgi:DNA-binding transcriptional regulator GbsR (MarR family)
MRYICKCSFIFGIVLITSLDTISQPITPQIDKRVEMMSIVSRLAEYVEYSQNDATQYVADIHSHFDDFKGDTLIVFAKSLREELGIGFDAIMSMAVNLKLADGKFLLVENWEKDLHKRWPHDAALQYVSLLSEFYAKTNAEAFFEKEKGYYQKITTAFEETLTNFYQPWYEDYYGISPKDQFNIIIACGNGGANYSSRITIDKQAMMLFAIMGSRSFDEEGNPQFAEEDYLPTLIHEFNHTYINPVLNDFQDNNVLQSSMQKILDTVKADMKKQGYSSWETVFNESLVRATVIRYLMKHKRNNPEMIEREMMDQLNRGFLWTRELVVLLGTYEANRKKYPTIQAFYPEIIDFFEAISEKIQKSK